VREKKDDARRAIFCPEKVSGNALLKKIIGVKEKIKQRNTRGATFPVAAKWDKEVHRDGSCPFGRPDNISDDLAAELLTLR
jgi:hypothetical protein